MGFTWAQIPFLRLLFPFLGGILFEIYLRQNIPGLEYIILLIVLILPLWLYVKKLNLRIAYNMIFGALLCAALFLSGISITRFNTEIYKSDHFSRMVQRPGLALVKISEPLLEKERSLKVAASVMAVHDSGKWIPVSGRAMLYFEKDTAAARIKYGDRILVKADFAVVKPPQNPSEFNYKQYLSFHNIHHQAYVPSDCWKFTGKNEGYDLFRYSYSLRDELLDVMKENGITGDEFAVASALVLGYEDKLDADIISAYASTGALHVLSVSGLHVGILYLILSFLFAFLNRIRYGPVVKAVVLLLSLWFYALLTGLSPSVLRAVTMFSFIVIGVTFRYHTNIFNTLAVSCFALLLYNPYLVMEVGFQLSYLAVFGIVYIQPKLYDWWRPDNWLLDKIWTITSVSIAAQLATFPLGLLYFHQFPNLFLFSNLIVIPLSMLVLFLGIVLFLVSKLTWPAFLAGQAISWTTWLLNRSVQWMEDIPNAIIQGVSISIAETWLIYAVIALFVLFLVLKRKAYLYYSLMGLIVVLGLQAIQSFMENRQKRFVVYSVPGMSAIDFISGKRNILYADSALLSNPGRMLFHVKHNWWDSGIKENLLVKSGALVKEDVLYARNCFIQFYDKRIIRLARGYTLPAIRNEQPVKAEAIVLSHNCNVAIKTLKRIFDARIVIIDASNRPSRVKKWKMQCEELGIDYHVVAEKGAFVLEV
ncbi:MAG: ComEC/Rec2 family competence protein [Bacteroidota bacterium]